MKAAWYEKQGPANEVLQVTEVATPKPGPGEVLVRVHSSGLNPTDLKARSAFSSTMKFPRIIPHQDGAGVIEAVGEGVSAGRLHQRVWLYEAQYGRAWGTAAQYIALPEQNAVVLPENIDFDTGAALGIPALTAHRCLFADGSPRGLRVLIHGGAGAVGSAAIMLAKWAGAWVAATVRSPAQAEAALAYGADRVLYQGKDDIVQQIAAETEGQGVDRIIDVNLMENLSVDLACLARDGVICAYATPDATAAVPVPLLNAMMQGCVLRFVYIYHAPQAAKQQAIADITRCLQQGNYHPRIAAQFALDDIADAHQMLEAGGVTGKIVLHPA